MAHTAEGLVLARTHSQAQADNVARTLQEATVAYRGLLDPEDVDGSFRAYASVQSQVVEGGRARADAVAGDYYRSLRGVEAPDAPALQPWNNTGWALLGEERARLTTSLAVTGPVAVKRATGEGLPPNEAMDRGLQATLGAVGRHVTNAQRGRIIGEVRTDPSSGGWARTSTGTPCSFCAMLIGRGPVYSQETVKFRSHDHCNCRAEPFFQDSGWTEQAAELRDLWNKTGKQANGPEAARRAFARAYQDIYGRGGMGTGRPVGVHTTRR